MSASYNPEKEYEILRNNVFLSKKYTSAIHNKIVVLASVVTNGRDT